MHCMRTSAHQTDSGPLGSHTVSPALTSNFLCGPTARIPLRPSLTGDGSLHSWWDVDTDRAAAESTPPQLAPAPHPAADPQHVAAAGDSRSPAGMLCKIQQVLQSYPATTRWLPMVHPTMLLTFETGICTVPKCGKGLLTVLLRVADDANGSLHGRKSDAAAAPGGRGASAFLTPAASLLGEEPIDATSFMTEPCRLRLALRLQRVGAIEAAVGLGVERCVAFAGRLTTLVLSFSERIMPATLQAKQQRARPWIANCWEADA